MFFFPSQSIKSSILSEFGRRNKMTMKMCIVFFSFCSYSYTTTASVYSSFELFSALTKQFIPFKIALLFPFRHVFTHIIIYGKMIFKMWIQMRTHEIRKCTRNEQRDKEEKNTYSRIISCCMSPVFLRFHLSRCHFGFHISTFFFTWPCVYSIKFVCLL